VNDQVYRKKEEITLRTEHKEQEELKDKKASERSFRRQSTVGFDSGRRGIFH